VQIEAAVNPLRRDTVDKPISSFVAEAYGGAPEVAKFACSSVLETAAEKLVALTWRAGSELAGLRDPTLVRHIDDLHQIRGDYDAAEVAIEGIPKDRVFVDGFAEFQRDMVYGDKPDFNTAMGSVNVPRDELKKPTEA
jgi:hypothetical protein